MGDKKGKKDKAKGQRQNDAKQAKVAKQRQDRQKNPALVNMGANKTDARYPVGCANAPHWSRDP